MIGEGSSFVYDDGFFRAGKDDDDKSLSGTLLRAAGTAPVLTNVNANGDGITIRGKDIQLTGLLVTAADRHGIYALSDGGNSLGDIMISNSLVSFNGGDGVRIEAENAGSAIDAGIDFVVAANNKNGIRFYASDDASASGMVQKSLVTANAQHGVIIYDDSSAGAVDVDLGGGERSTGANALLGNTLEELALDIDGATLSARNNWWGQPGGPAAGQVFKGLALEDNLVEHWQISEGSGGTTSGRINGTTATLVNNPAWSTRDGAPALDLSASAQQYFETADNNGFDTGSQLTVSYWINPETLSTGATQLAKWDYLNLGSSSWGIRSTNADSGEIFAFIAANPDSGDNFLITNNLDLAADEWTLITMAYNGAGATNQDRLKVYKNGQAVATSFNGIIPGSLNNTSFPVRFGAALTNDPLFAKNFDGRFDEMRIYNSTLGAGEIGQIYRENTTSNVDAGGALAALP